MNKIEELAEKKSALAALAPEIESDAEGALEKGAALKAEIETLEEEIKRDEQKAAVLNSIGTVENIKEEKKNIY